MNSAMLLIFAAMAAALLLGLRARHGKDMTLQQWTVAGRSFGSLFVFVLAAGEIYTTFTFLGGAGYSYGKGAPVYYILAYGTLAYVFSYWLLPPIWRYARDRQLISLPDFVAAKYGSPALGVLAAAVGIVALIPYLVLQLKGLGIIVTTASYAAISANQGVWIGAVVVASYVFASGVHGSAWTAVVKDILVLAVAVFLGLYLPFHYYGGIGEMFAQIEQAKPGFLALPATGLSPTWLVSTVALSALGFYMWPHAFAAALTARSDDSLRRNACILPLYQLILLFVFFVGFAAVLQVPGLRGGDIDLALFKIAIKTFDPWFVGVIGAAGVLTALVPGSMIVMTAATLIADTVYRSFRPRSDDAHIAAVAKAATPCVMAVAVYFTLDGSETIVSLLLMGYAFVTQLFPVVVASLFAGNPVTRTAAFASIAVGEAAVAWMSVTATSVTDLLPFLPAALKDLNVGIAALALNVVTLVIVTAITRRTAAAPGSAVTGAVMTR